jgi:hypothetical protein
VSPQEPDTRYDQLIVITRSANETATLIKTLRSELPEVAPEALVLVKELQQGSQIESPVEVRISGDDIAVLKKLGDQVEGILREMPIATYVCNDYYDDSWKQNSNLRIDKAKVHENQYHAAGTRSDELPQVKTDTELIEIARTQNLTIPAGSLGAYPGIGLLPGSTVLINQGNHNFFITNTTWSSL